MNEVTKLQRVSYICFKMLKPRHFLLPSKNFNVYTRSDATLYSMYWPMLKRLNDDDSHLLIQKHGFYLI